MRRLVVCLTAILCTIGHINAQSKHDALVGNAIKNTKDMFVRIK